MFNIYTPAKRIAKCSRREPYLLAENSDAPRLECTRDAVPAVTEFTLDAVLYNSVQQLCPYYAAHTRITQAGISKRCTAYTSAEISRDRFPRNVRRESLQISLLNEFSIFRLLGLTDNPTRKCDRSLGKCINAPIAVRGRVLIETWNDLFALRACRNNKCVAGSPDRGATRIAVQIDR